MPVFWNLELSLHVHLLENSFIFDKNQIT
jgi:hypothetical protein